MRGRRFQKEPVRPNRLIAALIGCGLLCLCAGVTQASPNPGKVPATPFPSTPAPSMVEVPEGVFFMGCNDQSDKECERDERPGREIFIDTFYIDRQEVTVASYAACVEAGRCTTFELNRERGCNWGDADRRNHPMNCVDWEQSSAFCAWDGKRLPTEAEWEKAARGTTGAVFPWGDSLASCALAVMSEGQKGCGLGSTWPVCSKPGGHSPYGVCDMSGNVMEWVVDWHAKQYYKDGPTRNPTGPTKGHAKVIRGGSWLSGSRSVRVSDRTKASVEHRANYLGFRCARSVP